MLKAAPTTPVFKAHHRARWNGGWRCVIAMFGVALISTTAKAEIYYIHNDHRGAPLVMTDANKNVVWRADYAPFGKANVTVQTKVLNLRLPGQYFDAETGLHYNYFRDYDPTTGRYLQPDPIGLRGGVNPYVYANNNPLRFTDPLGLAACGTNEGCRTIFRSCSYSGSCLDPRTKQIYGRFETCLTLYSCEPYVRFTTRDLCSPQYSSPFGRG